MMEKFKEVCLSIANHFALISTSITVTVLAAYFIYQGFFPMGLSLADSFTLIVLVSMYLVVCIILIALLAFNLRLIFWIFFKILRRCLGDKKYIIYTQSLIQPKTWDDCFFLFFFLLISVIVFTFLTIPKIGINLGWDSVFAVAFIIFVTGVIEILLHDKTPANVGKVVRYPFYPVVIFGCLVFLIPAFDIPLKIIGIKVNDVSVHIEKPYDAYLKEYAIDYNSESGFGSNFVMVSNTDILWTGLGDETVVRFKNAHQKEVKFSIPSDKLHVIDKKISE